MVSTCVTILKDKAMACKDMFREGCSTAETNRNCKQRATK